MLAVARYRPFVKARLPPRRAHSTALPTSALPPNIPPLTGNNTAFYEKLMRGKPIEVRVTPNSGRGLFATRDIPKGQSLWREKPIVSSWHSGNVDYCWTCFLPLEEPVFSISSDAMTKKNLKGVDDEELVLERNQLMQDLQIARFDKTKLIVENESMNVRFCSPACKHEAHENFKPLLNALRMKLPPIVAASEMDEHQRGMFNVMARLICLQMKNPAFLPGLLNHMMIAPKEVFPECQKCSTPPIAQNLPTVLTNAPSGPGFSKSVFWKVRSLIKVNSFFIRSFPSVVEVKAPEPDARLMRVAPAGMDRFVRSIALFETGCLFNHSCAPNAVHSIHYNSMTNWIAKEDIKEGDELLGNYVPLDFDFQQRQDILSNVYGFECKCPRCLADRQQQRPPQQGSNPA